MKVLIQSFGETPATVLSVLERERPEVSHVICSAYQLRSVAGWAGFNKPNEEVVRETAEKFGTRVIFHTCDVFDPSEVGDELRKILEGVDSEKDELVIDYTGETAVVGLLLGALGVVVSILMKAKVSYAIGPPEWLGLPKDPIDALRDIFQRLKMTA
jgi:hypothetical protein